MLEWRFGQIESERLCADLLQVEGFSDIDPQAPLGGPDGQKDILLKRAEINWLAAVYFPTTHKDYKDIRKKFCNDFEGVKRHNKDGFVFLTNQRITPTERADLNEAVEPTPVNLYHLERIRSLLDSPKGYGLRLEYLRIPMTMEEQQSLYGTLKDEMTEMFMRQESHLLDLHNKMDKVLQRTMEIATNLLSEKSGLETISQPPFLNFPTADLQVGDIQWIHRLLSDGTSLPRSAQGKFRKTSVWIGNSKSTSHTASFTPPPANKIGELLQKLVMAWSSTYQSVSRGNEDDQIKALAEFHHGFLNIHPFLDFNGKVARALLQQQARELTGRYIEATFANDRKGYFKSLSNADAGDQSDLIQLIKANLE